MTENKPVAWVYESTAASTEWRWYASPHRPEEKPYRRNITPVYGEAPQSDADLAVEAALKEATGLAMVLWRKHYAETAPNWTPLTNLLGVLSQIDNMTAGLAPKALDADPAVEAARRKALKAIFAKLAEYPTRDDRFTVALPLALLRDLVGEPRKQPEQKVWGYDETATPLTGQFLNEFREAALDIYAQQAMPAEMLKPQPARLSVDQIAEAMSGADGLTFRFSGPCQRMARAVHEAIYGKGE